MRGTSCHRSGLEANRQAGTVGAAIGKLDIANGCKSIRVLHDCASAFLSSRNSSQVRQALHASNPVGMITVSCGPVRNGRVISSEVSCSQNLNSLRPAKIASLSLSLIACARSPSTQVPLRELRSRRTYFSFSREIMKCRRESQSSSIFTSTATPRPIVTALPVSSHLPVISPSPFIKHNVVICFIRFFSGIGSRFAQTAPTPSFL